MSETDPPQDLAGLGGDGAGWSPQPPGPARRPNRRARRKAQRRARRAARSRTRRYLTRTAIVLVVLVVVIGGSGLGYAIYQLNQIGRVKVKGLTARPTTGKQAGTENILLVGSTDRCAVHPAKNFQNFVNQCENGVNGINSDVVMILHVAPNKPVTLLSIPRDTFVPDARAGNQANKIDAALYNGPSQLVAAIQEDFGIPINHYVVLNFQSFANIVTALGGITMYFPISLYDPDSGLNISHAGCLHISGLEALALVRARHLYYDYDRRTGQWLHYDPSGDIGRIERVHLFLKALAEQVSARGLSNPVTDNSLLSALAPDLTVDTTFGVREMLSLLLDYHSKLGSSQQLTLPVVEDANTYYDYDGGNYNQVVFPTEPDDSNTIASFLEGEQPTLPPPAQVRVAVIDGTDSPSATDAAVASLRSDGFKVTSVSAQTPVGPISEATVVYSGKASLAAAERVRDSLKGTAALAVGKPPAGAQVALVTGSNSTVVHVASVASSPTTSGGTATSTTAAAAGSSASSSGSVPNAGGVLSTPTSASEKIPPYDPRPCPAS